MAKPVLIHELLITNPTQTDAIACLLVEKGLVTPEDILQKVADQRAVYQRILNPTRP